MTTEVIFNELSIKDSNNTIHNQSSRLTLLTKILIQLWSLGLPRVLRMSSTALNMKVCQDQTFRRVLYNPALRMERDHALILKRTLDKSPYIEELIESHKVCVTEKTGVTIDVEGSHGSTDCIGLLYAALTNGISLSLTGQPSFERDTIPVEINQISDQDSDVKSIQKYIINISKQDHVNTNRKTIMNRLIENIKTGSDIINESHVLFKRLLFGSTACNQLNKISGTEGWFSKLLHHLGAIDSGAQNWVVGVPFCPEGAIEFSVESQQTLNHGTYGPQRDFPVPPNYKPRRFSLHSKIHSENIRIYYSEEPLYTGKTKTMKIIIGYIGPHLSTVKYP